MVMSREINVFEASIEQIQSAYRSQGLTVRHVVDAYLRRIDAFDQRGPAFNAMININILALEEADRQDAEFRGSGRFVGSFHGVPIILKDQADLRELPTTLGSVLFEGYRPNRDCFVAARLREAGAIFLGKSTLGELSGGDTHGSLFGSTRNVYDLERTCGGSSGGSAVSVSASYCAAAIGQEGFASIRRPSAWNGIVGMRPTACLVSRTSVYGCWPSLIGSLGPMARSVKDSAFLLDGMVGYDADDPLTAHGAGKVPASFLAALEGASLKGIRLGVLKKAIGAGSEPGSEDFRKVDEAFDRTIGELAAAGAEIVEPIEIPDVHALLAKRAGSSENDEIAFKNWLQATDNPPYASRADMMRSNLFPQLSMHAQEALKRARPRKAYLEYLDARDTLMTNFLKVMADKRLDALVHKAVEHQPTLISDGVNPPYVNLKGAPHIKTFLVYVPAVAVPAGFTSDNLPVGVTFLGRPYDDAAMLRYAYAYEQATNHRRPPPLAPALS